MKCPGASVCIETLTRLKSKSKILMKTSTKSCIFLFLNGKRDATERKDTRILCSYIMISQLKESRLIESYFYLRVLLRSRLCRQQQKLKSVLYRVPTGYSVLTVHCKSIVAENRLLNVLRKVSMS